MTKNRSLLITLTLIILLSAASSFAQQSNMNINSNSIHRLGQQARLIDGNGSLGKWFSVLMRNHIFWYNNALIFEDITDTLGIASAVYAPLTFRRQLYYIPGDNQRKIPPHWRVVDTFSLRVFVNVPNLIELHPKWDQLNNVNAFKHEFNFFFQVGINKDDTLVSIRNVYFEHGDDKSKYTALARAIGLFPVFRVSTRMPITTVKGLLKLLFSGFDAKYVRDIMKPGDSLILPARYQMYVGLGARKALDWNLFSAIAQGQQSWSHDFYLRLDRLNRGGLGMTLTENKMSRFDYGIGMGAQFNMLRTRALVTDTLDLIPGVNGDDLSPYLNGHTDTPDVRQLIDLFTQHANGEITDEEFEELLQGITPETDDSFWVKASQKLTLFPLMGLAEYLNSIFTIGIRGGQTALGPCTARAVAFKPDLFRQETFDYFEKLMRGTEGGLIQRFANIAYKKRFNNLSHDMREMQYLFPLEYDLDTKCFDKDIPTFNMNILEIKRLRMRRHLMDVLTARDKWNDSQRYDIFRLQDRTIASVWGIPKTKDDKGMEITSVIKYEEQEGPEIDEKNLTIEEVGMHITAFFFEQKPARDLIDRNRPSRVSRLEVENIPHFFTNAFWPFMQTEQLFAPKIEHEDFSHWLTQMDIYLNQEMIDLILDSPKWREVFDAIKIGELAGLEARKAMEDFAVYLIPLRSLKGVEKYREFFKFIMKRANRYYRLSSIIRLLIYYVGMEEWQKNSYTRLQNTYSFFPTGTIDVDPKEVKWQMLENVQCLGMQTEECDKPSDEARDLQTHVHAVDKLLNQVGRQAFYY
jgi:hypothetical protein